MPVFCSATVCGLPDSFIAITVMMAERKREPAIKIGGTKASRTPVQVTHQVRTQDEPRAPKLLIKAIAPAQRYEAGSL
jgi:hypothetical protein